MQFFIVNVFNTMQIYSMIDSQADNGLKDRHRQRDRQSEIDREKERQTQRERERERERNANRERKRRRQIEMQTHRDRQPNGWTDKEIIIRETEKLL